MHILGFALFFLARLAMGSQDVFQIQEAGWQVLPKPGGPNGTLVLHVRVEEGWHINAPAPKDPFLIPTRLVLQLPQGWTSDVPRFPRAKTVKLDIFAEPMEVLEGDFWVSVAISAPLGALGQSVTGYLEAQACNDVSCLPPRQAQFSVPWGATLQPPAAATEMLSASQGEKVRDLRSGFAQTTFWLQLLLVFLGGLALNLTPCVYPIIPVTIGFFLTQTGGRRRILILASSYVLGMAVTYSALGVAAALTGRVFGAALQSPWVTGFIVAVVLALAASMFGFWEIRVPSRIANLAGGRQGALGSLFMGLIVGLVAAPCIGPFVLGLLAYVGQQQSVALGFALFFTLALGLGLPYLFLAVSTKALEKLPHSGAWMEGVRQLFGVLLVALAAHFARPLLPGLWGDKLLAATLILGAAYLAVLARPGREVDLVDRFMRLVTVGMVLAGSLLWPHRIQGRGEELFWEAATAATLEEAIRSGQPTIVDFYANWCLPCKELEEKTFSDGRVMAKLSQFRRLKVDLTKNSPEAERLRKTYEVLGVPTVLFFNKGVEVAGSRLAGFEDATAFLKRLSAVTGE
ncbi:MAG: cytochrome c biogenesis protein CcdA [Thermoanaerobaculaceae bacterium]